jgi:hypothetical protein
MKTGVQLKLVEIVRGKAKVIGTVTLKNRKGSYPLSVQNTSG